MSAEDIRDCLGSPFSTNSLLGRGTLLGVRKTPGVSGLFLGFSWSLSVLCDIGVTLIVSSRDLWSRDDTGVLCTEPIKFLLTASNDCFVSSDDNWLSLDLEAMDFPDCWEFLLTDGIVSLEGEGLIMFPVSLLNEWWVSWGGEGLIMSSSSLLKEQQVCWGGEGPMISSPDSWDGIPDPDFSSIDNFVPSLS